MPHNALVSWLVVLTVFVVVPAKVLYHNTTMLRPLARASFALTAPIIFLACVVGAFITSMRVFGKWIPSYAPIANTLVAVTLALLVVHLWYRLFRVIARQAANKSEPGPVENTKRLVGMSSDAAALKKRIHILDASFYSMIAFMVNAGVVDGSGHSMEVSVIFLLVYLIALGMLVSRVGKSWITCVGLSLTGIGLIVIFFWIRLYANNYLKAVERRVIGWEAKKSTS